MSALGSRRKVLALVAENENNALAYASEGMSGFFAPFGYETVVLDLLRPDGLQRLASLLSGGEAAFAYGFAGIGSQLQTGDNISLWTALRTPFVSFWYDHPCYHYRQHIADSPYVLNCYHIEDHYRVWRDYLPRKNAAILLPPPAGPNPLARSAPWEGRERRFLFAKTAYNPEELAASWKTYPAALQQVLWGLIEQAKADRHLDLTAATAALFAKLNEPITQLDTFMGVVQTVDHYIRAWRGDQLARALTAYPAQVCGRGWDYLAKTPGRAEFLPAFPSSETWPRLARTRLAANVNPLWREGIHERVMNAVASGTVVVTDNSERGDKILGDLPHYVGFEWTDQGIRQGLAQAWEKSADGAPDYVEAGLARAATLTYNAENFMRPLERALQELCLEAAKVA